MRVAGFEPGGEPALLAEVAGPLSPAQVRALLAGLTGGAPVEVVIVGDGADPPDRAGCSVVSAVPVPAAAAAGGGGRLVVDAGHTGTVLSLLDPSGHAEVVRRCGVGGARLDGAVAELLGAVGARPGAARAVREALSLLPAVRVPTPGGEIVVRADEVRAALTPLLTEIVEACRVVARGRDGPVPVLLVGGVARTPLLAELLDAAGVGPVTVADRPQAAAVLGALRADDPVTARPAPPVVPRWLPNPPRHRRGSAHAVVAGLLAVAGAALLLAGPGPVPEPGPAAVVQYGYGMRLPDGWAHTGGMPERRRTLLTPVGAPEGSDLVVVERTPLGYDAAAEPARALADLRAALDSAVAGGAAVRGVELAGSYAGRPVATYRQDVADGALDWYVLLDGPDQLSVGCRHTLAGAAQVRRACAVVVGSLRRQP
ncbi:MAG: type VII secretion-associated protein [Pseudonocardia sp.]